MSNTPLLTYVTCPDQDLARQIAHTLVEAGCAACVNIVPGLLSTYRWQGKIETDEEVLLMIKTSEQAFEKVQAQVLALHPDDLPEIIAIPLRHGLPGYLDWMIQETSE